MRRDIVVVTLLWALFTLVGEGIAFTVDFLPVQGAEEAAIIDEAFRLLLVLSIPVAALVLAFLLYSLFRFRASDGELQDGPPVRNHPAVARLWVLGSLVLAVYIVFNPGLKGIRELEANRTADLVIQIEGVQWHWNVRYPQYDLSYEWALQIAMPVDTRVKFEITSQDVIHSVWIPAFRTKMDAVPGKVTTLYVTPTQVGTYEADPNFRVQCAELCGTGHPLMRMTVRVLEPEAFQEWLEAAKVQAAMAGGGMSGMSGMGEEMGGMGEGSTEMESDAGH